MKLQSRKERGERIEGEEHEKEDKNITSYCKD
jgi:hypothetical protein